MHMHINLCICSFENKHSLSLSRSCKWNPRKCISKYAFENGNKIKNYCSYSCKILKELNGNTHFYTLLITGPW